jgi:hypothetical protein
MTNRSGSCPNAPVIPAFMNRPRTYLAVHNNDPKPFVWTATAESILAKVRRGRVALQQVVSQ